MAPPFLQSKLINDRKQRRREEKDKQVEVGKTDEERRKKNKEVAQH